MTKENKPKRSGMSRRGFFRSSVAAAAGLGIFSRERIFGEETDTSAEKPKIKKYRILGRTGFKSSDIGFGTASLTDEAVLATALDTGVNYIDTAPNYSRGGVERIVGSAIKKRDRKSLFITTKVFWMGDKITKEWVKDMCHRSLERLQTDYIDCYMIHGGSKEKVKNEKFHAAVTELKSEGKVRFCGLSNHGVQYGQAPERMDDVIGAAAEDGRFDVFLFAYNYLQREMGENVLKICQEKNIGTTLMKTNPVWEYVEFKEYMDSLKESGKEIPEWLVKRVDLYKERVDQSEDFKRKYDLKTFDQVRDTAIKFVLSHPAVNTVTFSFSSYDQINSYIALSGKKLEGFEEKMLSDYASATGRLYCRHACGECESQCPHKVPVNTIMRYNHYFRAQGREKDALEKYASLSRSKADVCAHCSGYCERACPYEIPIQGLLTLAHKTLTI